MTPAPREARPFFKLRCAVVVGFFCVFVPGGHIALPQFFAFLRFLSPANLSWPWDSAILVCTSVGVAGSLVPLRRAALLLDVAAALGFIAAIGLVQWRWADPFDDGMLVLTAVPWGVLTVALFVRHVLIGPSPTGILCPKCGYDRTGLAAGAVCPECGSCGPITASSPSRP